MMNAIDELKDIVLRLSNIIQNEKIDQDAKSELEMLVDELYNLEAQKDEENDITPQAISQTCEGVADSIDRIIQTYQIEDREAELLEDISADLLSVKNRLAQKTTAKKHTILDEFIEK